MRIRGLTPLAALLASAMLSAPLHAQAGAPPEVEDVDFEGVRALDERLVAAAILTREGRCRSPLLTPLCALGSDWASPNPRLDDAELRRDEERIARLYDSWGYPDATARAEVHTLGDGDVRVVFHVTEGEPVIVRSLAVTGLDTVVGATPLPTLALRPGDAYATPALEETQRRIALRLADLGHPFATIEVGGSTAGRRVDLVLAVDPGPVAVFGPTVIRAERPLREADVRRRLAYREGDRFTPAALERTAERLYALPIVDTATLQPAASAEGTNALETRVAVSTGRIGTFGGDVFYSSSTCLGGQVQLENRYFLGAPRTLVVAVGGSNVSLPRSCNSDEGGEFDDPNYFVDARLRQPLGPETWLLLEGGFSREAAPRAYVRSGARGRIGVGGRVAPGTQAIVAYAPERSDQEAAAPFFCALYGACAGAALAELTGRVTIAPAELDLAWSRGRRVPAVLPESAWARPAAGPRWLATARASLSAAGGVTGSEAEFASGTLRGTATRLFGRTELAARGRVGLLASAERLPPQLRLFGGGPGGVRGAPANLLGPKILLVREGEETALGCPVAAGACEGVTVDPEAVSLRSPGGEALVEGSVEARLWLGRGLLLAAFVDAGALWSGADPDAPSGAARSESLVTPGVGIGLNTPAGPIRVDVAYDPSPARRYPLLARQEDGGGYVQLGEAVFDPYGFGSPGGTRRFFRRLQLQLSMGWAGPHPRAQVSPPRKSARTGVRRAGWRARRPGRRRRGAISTPSAQAEGVGHVADHELGGQLRAATVAAAERDHQPLQAAVLAARGGAHPPSPAPQRVHGRLQRAPDLRQPVRLPALAGRARMRSSRPCSSISFSRLASRLVVMPGRPRSSSE
jgi:translocation and assembly module TamA